MDCDQLNGTSSVVAQAARRRARLTLRGSAAPASAARNFSRLTLGSWGLADGSGEHGLPDDIVLVVSELVTNADRHGGGPEWLALSASWGDSIRVEVADLSRRLPAMLQPPAPARPEGHGLRLVQRAADRVGVELWRNRPGKSVWAEFHWIHRLHRIHGIAAEGGPEPPDVATAG